jgi:hypothetical protein
MDWSSIFYRLLKGNPGLIQKRGGVKKLDGGGVKG